MCQYVSTIKIHGDNSWHVNSIFLLGLKVIGMSFLATCCYRVLDPQPNPKVYYNTNSLAFGTWIVVQSYMSRPLSMRKGHSSQRLGPWQLFLELRLDDLLEISVWSGMRLQRMIFGGESMWLLLIPYSLSIISSNCGFICFDFNMYD